MEPLELSFIHIGIKEVASRSTIRLIATLTRVTSMSEYESRAFMEWFDRFFEYIERERKPFCLIYMLHDTVENPEDLKMAVDALNKKRHITRQYSVTTCVVASGLVAMVANMAMGLYGTQGKVHITETLEDAKRICRDESYNRTEGSG